MKLQITVRMRKEVPPWIRSVVSEYDYDYWHAQSITLFLIANDAGNPTVKAANNIFYAGSATPGKKPEPFSLFYN